MKIVGDKTKTPSITFKTSDKQSGGMSFKWWKAKAKKDLASEIIGTATYLKQNQSYRYRQAAAYARLYGNQSLFNFVGSSIGANTNNLGLPLDRPTFNLVQSAADTLISRISQSRPSPVFLTDGSDYKERNAAKKLNNFIQGEFYQTKTYEKAAIILRDALVLGSGAIKIYETVNSEGDSKVGLERRLVTELLIDPSEGMYGDPRQLLEIKLVDRGVLEECFPDFAKEIALAERAYPDNSAEANKSIADLVMLVEAWHLPSGPDADDGRHVIACSSGVILDEKYKKDKFPFVFLHYSNRLLGFWAQGLAEQLMGTQLEINSLLWTISKAIKLVGVPRVFVEQGSKVVKAHLNNDIGSIVTYSGTKPSYEVAKAVPEELYAQLQRMINYGYQQCGVSSLDASAQKPAGLNSGEAIRAYDDISTDRFASLAKKYETFFTDLAYQIIDLAMDIAKRDGKYQTIFPDKNGTKQIDLPKMSILKNPFVIQCFSMSSLPRDPAGRLAKITEMIQAGMITIKEGRRLLDYPDIEQVEKLANAAEERIFQILDEIIENGDEKYTPPDPFMDLDFAETTVVQYINLYGQMNLEEDKMELLRSFFKQIQALKQAAMPPPMAPAAQQIPQATPEAPPESPLLPFAGGSSGQAAA